jgi:hypothetical protein
MDDSEAGVPTGATGPVSAPAADIPPPAANVKT